VVLTLFYKIRPQILIEKRLNSIIIKTLKNQIVEVVILFGSIIYFSPIKIAQNDTYEIDPLRAMSLTQHRDKGERVEGYFTVLGGNDEIEFHIEDPYGTTIFDAGIVDNRKDFAFTTEYEGVYTLFFGNKQQESGKTVFLTVQRNVTQGVDVIIIVIGVCFLILGLVVLYQERLKQRNEKTQNRETVAVQ
jgi:hypothetical protein